MPNQTNQPQQKKNNPAFSSRKYYLRWYFSSLILVAIIAGLLIYQAATIYMRAIDMVNSSNQKMVAKSGIEIDAELNIENLDLAQRIIDKKMNPPDLPARVRNIFVFDSYIATDGSRTTTGTVAAAPKPATATNTHE